MKEIAILGSTGSIGTQALEVIRLHPDLFHAQVLAAHGNVELLLKQAHEFNPSAIVITDKDAGEKFKSSYNGSAEVYIGDGTLEKAAVRDDVDIVLVSVVGINGLLPSLEAIRAGKEIALANKETLVAGGALVIEEAKKHHTLIRPVDSEHSAIFQCLLGQDIKKIHKLILTSSGGPFLGKTREDLENVSLSDALKHPTWHMGQKVTLDSATMFNKGLEVIEAHWLFGVDYDDIDVVIQPQSIIHSMVEYIDGSIIAQMGNPDMRLPIQFAFTYPKRMETPSHEFMDWKKLSAIKILQPDYKVFRSLKLAYQAGKAGGDMTTVFNAANEEAIKAFIRSEIKFLSIFDVVEEVLDNWDVHDIHSIEDVISADKNARIASASAIQRFKC